MQAEQVGIGRIARHDAAGSIAGPAMNGVPDSTRI